MAECKKFVSATQFPEQAVCIVAGVVFDWAVAKTTSVTNARHDMTTGNPNLWKMDFCHMQHPPELY
jgi:hypothetical protein